MISNDLTSEAALALESLMPEAMTALFRIENDPLRDRPVSQIRLLRMLYEQDRSCRELMDLLGMSASSVSQIASRLISTGLVEKYGVEDDGRTRMHRLTDRGRELMDSRRQLRADAARNAILRLKPEQVSDLISTLAALANRGRSLEETEIRVSTIVR